MVKSGKYTVNQPSIAGRIGTNFGQGLAEQLPKEIQHQRLSAGLKDFAENAGNLSPLEAFAKAGSIYGITPQMVQALPELLKQQRLRQSFSNRAGRQVQGIPQEQPIQTKQQFEPSGIGVQGNEPRIFQPQETVRPEEFGQPQITPSNPIREEALPRIPWSPERRDDEIARVWDERPDLPLNEVMNIAADNERRYLEMPKAVQEQDDYRRNQEKLADQEFTSQLETKLQKTGEGVFKDISGENLVNLKRSMHRDMATNPKASVNDLANKWTNKALDLTKSKNIVNEQAKKSLFDKLTKKRQRLDKLKSLQKIYAETGNQEEYYNRLREKDFGLSPHGAASIAFPLSKGLNAYINEVKPLSIYEYKPTSISSSRKYAIDIENLINRDDSLLAVARALYLKDRTFDQRSFFNQLREDQDRLGLNPRQKRELSEGEADFLPNWGDILLLPVLRGK